MVIMSCFVKNDYRTSKLMPDQAINDCNNRK
jgi:hypothetical protein